MFTAATTALIKAVLGEDTDPLALRRRHPDTSAEYHLASLVLTAARRLSNIEQNLHQRLRTAAGPCNPYGELQRTGTDIDLLAARHSDAHEWLVETLHVYREATTGH